MLRSVALSTLLVASAFAAIGFDTRRRVDQAHFTCIAANESTTFFIGQIWDENGRYDTQGINNLKNAVATNYKIDGLFLPCLRKTCAHASNQFEAAVNRLTQENVKVDTIWIGIARGEWHDDHTINQQVTTDIIAQADKMNQKVGFHTNQREWEGTMGGNFNAAAAKPLWWAHHDNTPGMGNFTAFAGWTAPAMHQYEGERERDCGGQVRIQLDFRP